MSPIYQPGDEPEPVPIIGPQGPAPIPDRLATPDEVIAAFGNMIRASLRQKMATFPWILQSTRRLDHPWEAVAPRPYCQKTHPYGR